ncbi:hypothetical protein ALC53_09796 [Atta colombica]|uniref:Double jelly roll-like domain-containing protein n=1 Tax=Atta colombica TaxID=520822 RepID=A0A195B5G1_9HYME|nr:hypothetical protein ALC53_09796 [Atta colombica]
MVDILNITNEPIFNIRIIKIKIYNPAVRRFLYIEGRLTVKKKNDQMSTTLGNNCIACLMKFNMNSTVESDRNRNIRITSIIKNYVSVSIGKRYLSIFIRDLCEYLLLQNVTKHLWAVKTATQLEKPRYVIFALQILDFYKKRYAVLFNMYARFRKPYYGINYFETLLNVLSFIEKGPFAVINCSRQNESVKSALPAYCLILHDHVIVLSVAQDYVNCKISKYLEFQKGEKTRVKHNLEELLVMVISMFVDLQSFIVEKRFIVKQIVVLK